MDHFHLPLIFHFEAENGLGGRVELTMPDPHHDRKVVLKAAMVDHDAYFGVGRLSESVLVAGRARLDHFDGKGAANLGVRHANAGFANPHIIAELEVAGFLG